MRDIEVIEYRRQQIKRFINITSPGKENEALHIDFDNLVRYLMQAPGVSFAATEYENLLKRELDSKIVNRPLSPQVMDTVSDYMWDLALYCSNEKAKVDKQHLSQTRERALQKHELAEKLKADGLR